MVELQCVICLYQGNSADEPVGIVDGHSFCREHLMKYSPSNAKIITLMKTDEEYEDDPYWSGGGPGSWEAGRVDYTDARPPLADPRPDMEALARSARKFVDYSHEYMDKLQAEFTAEDIAGTGSYTREELDQMVEVLKSG